MENDTIKLLGGKMRITEYLTLTAGAICLGAILAGCSGVTNSDSIDQRVKNAPKTEQVARPQPVVQSPNTRPEDVIVRDKNFYEGFTEIGKLEKELGANPTSQGYVRLGDLLYAEGWKENLERIGMASRKAVEFNRKNPEAHNNLGIYFKEKRLFDEAIRAFNTSLRLDDNDKSKASTYHNLGNLYYQNRMFHKSVEAYETAVKLNPDYESSKRMLARARIKISK